MDNIRSESFLGGNKIVVGNKYTDLVLETLGKVYIKTGDSSKVLSDVLKLLDKPAETDLESQTIIVGSVTEMEEMEYPGDGYFVFNTLTKSLYISYDERYVALIESSESVEGGYVRRSGDTMTGSLEINSISAPLIVASSRLVKNLNTQYIDGYASNDLAKIRKDEYILGNWTFRGKGVSEESWTFKRNTRMYGDLVSSGSLVSPEFASGFGGYGWRLDADTNTLTIDNLVVRKAMRVYEMVINKISATNGSLWISNASKCVKAEQPMILTKNQLLSASSNEDILGLISSNTYYLPQVDNNVERVVTKTEELSTASKENIDPVTFIDYKFIILVKDPIAIVNNPLFTGSETLYDEALLTASQAPADYEDEFRNLTNNLQLYYINKESVVTSWNDTTPVEWKYRHTFKKETEMLIVPKSKSVEFETNGTVNIVGLQPYYKYFGLRQDIMNTAISQSNISTGNGNGVVIPVPNLWVVNTDEDEFPPFKPGDIIRCQKYSEGNIKYYEALIMSQIGARRFILQKAVSVFDMYTEMSYSLDGSEVSYTEKYNNTQYNKTELGFNTKTGQYETTGSNYDIETGEYTPKTVEDRLDDIAAEDDMVQIGNIFDKQRQNSLYLTSSDDDGPFIDVISGLNRPDYSVLYDVPIFETKKVNLKRKGTIYERQEEFVVGGMSDYYFQTVNPGCINPLTIPDDIIPPTKEYPLVFLKTKDISELLINDGIQEQITQEILDSPEEFGMFLTEIPTRDSQLAVNDKGYRHSYTKTTKVRIGNLDGIYNETFGDKQPYGFGLYGDNVFLTGEFYLNNGQSVVDFSSDGVFLKFKNAGLSINSVQDVERDEDGKPILDEDGNTTPKVDDSGKPVYERVQSINLSGIPIVDNNGNPVYQDKNEIVLTADQVKFNTLKNKTGVTIIAEDPVSGLAILDVQGNIQTNGLFIKGNEISRETILNSETGKYEYEYDPITGYYKDARGELVTKEGYFFNVAITKEGNCVLRGAVYANVGEIGAYDITNWGLINRSIENKPYEDYAWMPARWRNYRYFTYEDAGIRIRNAKLLASDSSKTEKLPEDVHCIQSVSAALGQESWGRDIIAASFSNVVTGDVETEIFDTIIHANAVEAVALDLFASGSTMGYKMYGGNANLAIRATGGVDWKYNAGDHWSMPGVLLEFRIRYNRQSGPSIETRWGNGCDLTSIVQDPNDGNDHPIARFYHDIGHSSYYVHAIASPHSWDNPSVWYPCVPVIQEKSNNAFSLQFIYATNVNRLPSLVDVVITGLPKNKK